MRTFSILTLIYVSLLLTLICYVSFLESQAYHADYLTRAVESSQVTVKGHAPHRTYIIN